MTRKIIFGWILNLVSISCLWSQNGLITLTDPHSGLEIIRNSQAVFVCNRQQYPTTEMKLIRESIVPVFYTLGHGNCRTLHFASVDGLEFGVEIVTYDHTGWISMNGWVKNTTQSLISLEEVVLIDASDGPLMQGHWQQTRALCGSTDRLEWLGNAAGNANRQLSARSFLGLYNKESGEEYTLGFSIKQAWGYCLYDFSLPVPHFTARVSMDVDIQPGEIRYAEALHIKKGKVWGDLQELITATGREVNALTDGKSFGGWCTWYGFNPFIDNDITEDAVVQFAEEAAEYKDLPFELMLLDDGYFTLPGDWTTLRPVFPNGMRYLTDACARNGLIPGIWVAATLVHENAEIFKEQSDWIDRKKDGSYHHTQFNWGGKTHSFDATHPAFLQHVDTLFRHIAHNWGYKYLKLDFNIEPGSNRVDRSITPFQAIRNFYKVVSAAVGDSVFIANCAGTPYSPVIGYAKAGRVGPDVNPNWESVLEGCRQSILHIPFHRRWWVNDPDCLNMREKRSQLTDEELQAHVTANFMGGGYVLFSDSLNELTPARHRMLAQALPTAGEAAEIVDYMTAPETGIPSLFTFPVERFGEHYAIVSSFNWDNLPLTRNISMADLGLNADQEYHVYDFWTDSYKGIRKGSLNIQKQKAHSCALMAIKPVRKGEIQVVSSDLHLLQGTKEITGITRMNTSPFDHAKAEIWIEVTPVSLREGKLVIAADPGLRVAACQGAGSNLIRRPDGLWDLNLSEMEDKVAIVLRIR